MCFNQEVGEWDFNINGHYMAIEYEGWQNQRTTTIIIHSDNTLLGRRSVRLENGLVCVDDVKLNPEDDDIWNICTWIKYWFA